jgi:hypothetical protein
LLPLAPFPIASAVGRACKGAWDACVCKGARDVYMQGRKMCAREQGMHARDGQARDKGRKEARVEGLKGASQQGSVQTNMATTCH